MAQEIERKFLVTVAPDPSSVAGSASLRQGYLAVDGGVEVRLRESGGATTMTIKAGRGLSRTEVEVALSAEEAEELWPYAAARSLHKVRHRIPLAPGVTAEVDVYDGALAGLLTVEVEFPDADSATAFAPPEWFGRELTGEPGWSNAELAAHGAPA